MSNLAERTPGDIGDSVSAVTAIEQIIRDWLSEPALTLLCGNWSHGGIMELLPRGHSAFLTPPRYEGRFAGLRDLRLGAQGHHVHLDLGQLSLASYCIAPSVCYDFKPALEMRLCAPGADPLHHYGLGFAIGNPYVGGQLDLSLAHRYLARLASHLRRFPGQVVVQGDRQLAAGAPIWDALDGLLAQDPALAPVRACWPAAMEAMA